MDIKQAEILCNALPSNQSVLMIGKHGVGKSQLVRRIARARHAELVAEGLISKDMPVHDSAKQDGSSKVDCFLIDMRLSQQSEGDMIGLPELSGGVTRFCPPEWFMAACREPRVLFFDEINRATPEVMQAAFQIVLDYQLNGFKLHPETRVFAAINPDSGNYSVNAMDDALLDRFAVIELEPTFEDWYTWATDPEGGDLLPSVAHFVKANPDFLDPPANADPGRVYPSRRSWELLDRGLRHANLENCTDDNTLLFSMAVSRVGVEAAVAFQAFVKQLEADPEADEILNKWNKKMQARIERMGVEKYNIITDKIGAWVKENTITKKQATNLAKLMELMPGEHVINLWDRIAGTGNPEVAKTVYDAAHKIIMMHLQDQFEKKAKSS